MGCLFQAEGVKMPRIGQKKTARWITAVAAIHGKTVGQISYLFCTDKKILEANKAFLNHDYYTDIITFDYSEGTSIAGDILVSLETVESNARKFSTSTYEELYRVIIHGVLHLCGINDKGPGEREKMEAEENKALELLKTL